MPTDEDNIELPPLPGEYYTFSKGEVREYGRACYEAGLAASRVDRERRAEQAQPAKPKVHWRTLDLSKAGEAVMSASGVVPTGWVRVALRWTDDGRAWIESERNREMAQKLRSDSPLQRHFYHLIADALDGGEG